MKFIASNSNGKDSLFMILELIRRKYPLDLVLFFDTGKEFDAIYDTWSRVKGILKKENIPWAVLKPENDFDYYFNEKEVKSRDGSIKTGYSWCGGICRWMTSFKTKAIKEYYKTHFPGESIVEYIGIAADEKDRVAVPSAKENILKMYPLIYWGYTENDCFVGCYKAGFTWRESDTDVELYQILDRVSCWCCKNKNLRELRNIHDVLPQYWEKLKAMQDKTEIPFKKDASIHALEERFAVKPSVLDIAEEQLTFTLPDQGLHTG